MRQSTRRAASLYALATFLAPQAAGWGTLAHVLIDDHHHATAVPERSGLELALHGHAHLEGTPAHAHPLLGNPVAVHASTPFAGLTVLAAQLPLALASPIVGVGRSPLAGYGPTHDPPLRAVPPTLRI